jgi:hypothetical protein
LALEINLKFMMRRCRVLKEDAVRKDHQSPVIFCERQDVAASRWWSTLDGYTRFAHG